MSKRKNEVRSGRGADAHIDDEPLSILVTGASRGIGRAVATGLAEDGYTVVVHYVNDIEGASACLAEIQSVGASARLLQFDIADRAATAEVLNSDMDSHGAYYGVVANAGVSSDAAFPMMSDDDWDRVLRTNLDGFYNVVKPIVMPMIRRRKPGRIVTMASLSGLMGNRGQVNYSASKGGIIAATKALAVELASRRITVNCVAPGLIDTDMAKTAPVEEMLKAIPAGRIGNTEEVAAVVRFLISDGASYVTRQVISVNGGLM